MRRPVGRQDDLPVRFVERVERMEEFLLCRILAGNELDVVDEEQIGPAVFAAELNIPALLHRGDQLVRKLVALDVDDVIARMLFMDLAGDGVEQMRLAEAGRPVDEQRVIGLRRGIGHRDGRRVGEAVGGADDKLVKRELRVELDKLRFLLVFAVGVDLGVVDDLEFDLHLELVAHRVLDIIGAAAQNDVLPKRRRGI